MPKLTEREREGFEKILSKDLAAINDRFMNQSVPKFCKLMGGLWCMYHKFPYPVAPSQVRSGK